MKPRRKVNRPPAQPLMVFDGDCHFCRRWIERWREMTGGRVEYLPSQKVASRFPEIPAEEWANAVQLIEPDGTVYRAAEAVFRALSYGRRGAWLSVLYDRLPGFAPVTEAAYRMVAGSRTAASRATRLLWGTDVRRPTYAAARELFLRALGAIYLVAFVSFWVQAEGLVGSRGILPVADFLEAARAHFGGSAPGSLPTLFWLDASDATLHLLCAAGVVLSLCLLAGFAPVISLIGLFLAYLSLTVGGQAFLSFQWDILLIETGFCAIFLAPAGWWLSRARTRPVSRAGLFLLKLLLFKLMFMSGAVKLTSGDPSWAGLSALNYHYETQPLPTVLGWWMAQGPGWLKAGTTFFILFAELAVPFLIWAPRRLRLIAASLLAGLQLGIMLTGNFAFFNLLALALGLLLLDDTILGRRRPQAGPPPDGFGLWWRRAGALVLLLTLPFHLVLIVSSVRPTLEWPRPVTRAYAVLAPFHIVNGYGLFRVMTRTRPEIVIEGSADGIDWKPYEFRWKPGPLDGAPRWVAPHQPRLDWQMWFAALGRYDMNPWFLRLLERLFENEPSVTGLLAKNPFPGEPPRYLRARLFRYHFTDPATRRETGAWWRAHELGEYIPTVSQRGE